MTSLQLQSPALWRKAGRRQRLVAPAPARELALEVLLPRLECIKTVFARTAHKRHWHIE